MFRDWVSQALRGNRRTEHFVSDGLRRVGGLLVVVRCQIPGLVISGPCTYRGKYTIEYTIFQRFVKREI